MHRGSEESPTETSAEHEPIELGASNGSHAPLQFIDVQPTAASQNNSTRSVRSLKHTFDRTRNNDIQIITPELCDWVQQCSEAVAELACSAATAAAAASADHVNEGGEAEARQDEVTKVSMDAHQRRHSRTGSCGSGPEAEANKAEARLASCVIHIVKVINDASCAVEVDTSIAVMTDCIFMLNDVVCVSEQSKIWEEQLPTQQQQQQQVQREEQNAQRPASSGSACSSNRRRKSTINDRLRNLRHALDGLQHRLEVLLLAIVRHRTVGVCRLRVDARTYRVGVNDSYVASPLPESLEVNVLRPLGEGLRSVLPMVASKLLSMALNEALNGVLDFLLEQRIMFNFSGVQRLHKDMEAIKGWVVRLKQLWACPPGQELLEDKSSWVRVNKVLMVLAGEEQPAPSAASSGNTTRNSTDEFDERNQWQSLRRSSWVENVRFWKSSSFRARRNAGIVPSIQLDFSEL